MRLIDADALFENLDDMMAVSPTGYIHGETVADMINDAPTVDAVPVIRCKDCKYWLGEGRWCTYDMNTTAEEYCSKAKRKNDE